MDRRCAAGALLALAACIASSAAAPTASNQTALDLYDGASEGCYYNFQHYGEGDRIMTNEPCLNCTCHNRMLMCYLRVCPFTKPIGQDCSVEKRADQCCPIVTCPDVPVDLLTSTSTSSPAEYGETGLGKLDRYGCSINGKYFPEGSKVPPSPNKPCEHCYCIRNMTTCVMQECTLHVDGCTPIYRKDVCCPVRYSCDHPEDEIPLLDDMTTTVRPTPGFLLTTTTLSPVTQMTQDCVHDEKVFADGALIKTEKACEHCYCMKGDIVCVVQECGTPMENEGKNCTSIPPREGQCCPDTYICEGDELTTESKPDIATVTSVEDITTLSPPRRVSIEGSGYRSETDEPFTEVPTFEPDTEGSGEEQPPFKPSDASDMLIPESETSPPFITTEHDENIDQYSPSTTKAPLTIEEMIETVTTEPDKGENTVPSGGVEDGSGASDQDETTPVTKTTTTILLATTESSVNTESVLPEDESDIKDKITPHEGITVTEPTSNVETTIAEHEYHTSPENRVTVEDELPDTTSPTRRKENDELPPTETTTLKDLEELTTKSSDLIAPDNRVTDTATSPIVEQEAETTIPTLPEKDNEVLVKEPTTDLNLDLTTKSDLIETVTQAATTVQSEIATEFSTPSKIESIETTPANPIENEIDEESFPTLAPGRIPGEGDCLLDGVTYSHESIVPSSNNCHASCKCISSIVKCDPIVCSPPPDYMDNCQPMYDSPESCCPTYVCDHPRETVPPQSHSQMAGTESPMPTPTIECDGDQCEIVKDKDGAKPAVSCTSEDCTVDSSKVPEECGPQGCGEVETKPEEHQPLGPTQDCVGDSCSSSPEHCANGKCETAIPKDQTCNNENGCEIPVVQTCQGDDCAIHPDLSESTSCDNPDGCKDAKIPEKSPICEGESCISELPPKTIPQETQDCKDSEDCARPNQSPVIEECHEEGCKKQQVPDINKPAPSDCTDTECIQKDHIPQITEAPELNTESIPKLTELSEALETKSEGPVTDLPKTTAIEKEIELNIPTEASISEKEELSGTTPQYDDMIIQKEKEPQPLVPESPEIVTTTPEIQPQEIITENNIDQITTTAPLQDITKKEEISPEVSSAPSEVPTTEIPLLSDKDIKEFTTELPGFADTELPESVTKPIDDTLLDDKHAEVTNPPGDVVNDKEVLDITTVEPSLPVVHDSSPDIIHETTESQEMLTLAPESMDRQGQEEATKEPEYVQDTEPKVTEPAEAYTTAPERMSTDKLKEEPLQEQEKQDDAPTTPKSYDSQTNVPETLGTKAPVEEVSDSDTIVPELQTTSPQLVNQETELPVSILSPEEPITVKPDDVFQTTEDVSLTNTKEDAETKTPVFDASPEPHMPLDESGITQAPELSGTSDVETSTRVPVQDITDEPESHTESSKTEVTLPQETVTQESDVIETEDKFEEIPAPVTVNVPTNTPMSIVKDHDDDEISITRSPESKISTERDDEVITKKPESPEFELPLSTESYGPKPEESLTEKPVSDIEQLPSVTNEQSAATTEQSESDLKTTISLIVKDEVATKQPHVSEITGTPETEISTDNTPVSVSIVEEPASSEYFEPSVTEAGIQVSSVSQEKTSESSPTTIMTSEDIETKSPDTATESSNKPEGDDSNYLTQDENMATTELPELIVHEHPTEPSPIGKEPEQPVSEEIATKTPDSAITELQEIEPEKDTTDAPMPHDAVTKVSETPTSELQNEMTEIPDHEFITETSESTQPETTDSKADDAMSHVPEIPATESQQEVTEAPETQGSATNIPVTTATDTQSEATEAPVSQEVVTSVPITSEIEPQETITEKIKSQDAVTNTPDMFATEPNKDSTEGPDSQESVTTPTDTFAEPHKESTDGPETLDKEPHKDIPEIQDTVTSIPEIFATESDKVITESPEPQDTSANVTEISPAESDKKATEEPETQDVVTSVPKTSVTEPQSETTKAPESQETVTNIPEIPETEPKKDTTETPAEDVATGIPEIPVTESVHVEETHVPEIQDIITTVPEVSVTEAEKDATEAPAHEDTFTNIPNVNAIEPQTESSKAPVRHDTTEVPDKFVTESQIDITQTLEPQNTATSAPELSKTESKKETTEIPESQEAGSTVPEISETEPKKEITEAPDSIIRAPETSATELHKEPTISPDMQEVDSNTPEITTPEYQKEATTAPEVQDIETKAPELLPKESQKATTETQETTEKIATEPHKALTELPESLNIVTDIPEATATESQKEVTVSSLAPEIATKAPEILDTESDKEITEAPEPDLITKTPERTQTEGETEQKEPDVTEKDETITEPPLKITTKLDDETQTEQQELITPTESSKIELETSQPTEERLPVDQSSKVPEALATESPDRITESVTETDNPTVDVAVNEEKPQEGQKIATEMPSTVEPTKTSEFSEPEISEVGTELPISPESVEIETKVPELSDTESGVTMAPELYVTEKQDYTHAPESETQGPIRTEATNSQVEEDIVTKAPEASEPQDKTRKPSEEPEQTSQSKDEYPETTPYLVILEEHTHKKDIYTTSLDEEITTTPSEIPQKEYESSTPQAAFAIPTESVQSTESEKLPLEDAMSDKDQSVTELIQTTEPAKITEPSVVSEELTTISPSSESQDTEKPQYVDTNEISTSAPTRDEEPSETEKPSVASIETETEKEVLATEKPHETTAPEEEFILATTKATTLKTEEELTTPSPLLDKFGKPDETPSPAAEPEKPKPDTTEEIPKPGANEIQPTEEAMQPEDESHFPPSGTSGYGQEPDYGEEDSFGPGTCRYGGKVYVSAQQIPRDDPCDFCFCFRSDIICLQQSCPPPIHGCHEEPIQGFCCPRYECPVSMATTLNVTTTTTTTTTTLPPHFLPHAYKGAAQRRGCQIKGHTYKVGEVVRASSGPCLHCTCGGDGQMKCDPKVCTPEPMLRQMIAAAVSAKRRR